MILSGPEILKQIEAGTIRVSPFDRTRLNPASLDLTLGDTVAEYRLHNEQRGIDSKVPEDYAIRRKTIEAEGVWLYPGNGYLMHTAERVATDQYVPILDGKSSIGRLFIQVHVTAGFGDPGFDGQYTLEVTTMFPVKVYPGMRICQIRFHAIQGEVLSYQQTGTYKGDKATGPIASQAWKSAFR
jgi:dCTP deaminase